MNYSRLIPAFIYVATKRTIITVIETLTSAIWIPHRNSARSSQKQLPQRCWLQPTQRKAMAITQRDTQ